MKVRKQYRKGGKIIFVFEYRPLQHIVSLGLISDLADREFECLFKDKGISLSDDDVSQSWEPI